MREDGYIFATALCKVWLSGALQVPQVPQVSLSKYSFLKVRIYINIFILNSSIKKSFHNFSANIFNKIIANFRFLAF